MVLIGIIIGAILVLMLTKSRKSKFYRKVLADLFVAGRIRQLAEDRKIDLGEEYDDYVEFYNKGRLSNSDLDDVIETDLMNDIEELNTNVDKKTPKK